MDSDFFLRFTIHVVDFGHTAFVSSLMNARVECDPLPVLRQLLTKTKRPHRCCVLVPERTGVPESTKLRLN